MLNHGPAIEPITNKPMAMITKSTAEREAKPTRAGVRPYSPMLQFNHQLCKSQPAALAKHALRCRNQSQFGNRNLCGKETDATIVVGLVKPPLAVPGLQYVNLLYRFGVALAGRFDVSIASLAGVFAKCSVSIHAPILPRSPEAFKRLQWQQHGRPTVPTFDKTRQIQRIRNSAKPPPDAVRVHKPLGNTQNSTPIAPR